MPRFYRLILWPILWFVEKKNHYPRYFVLTWNPLSNSNMFYFTSYIVFLLYCHIYCTIASVSHVRDRTRKSLCAIPYYVIQTQWDQNAPPRQNAPPLYTMHVTSFFSTSSVETISGYTISRSLVTYLQALFVCLKVKVN